MIKDKILCQTKLLQIVKELRQDGERLVFTNGCFDLMHAGHAQYLQEARGFGDILIVGLNSDASVRRLKGKQRPIIDQENRAFMLAALQSVDYVVIFEDDTPFSLIQAILPDILVKGGDWAVDEIVGSDIVSQNGGQVYSIALREGLSSSLIIQKIQGQK